MGTFGVICADPPWQYEDPLGGKKGMARKPGTVGIRRSSESKYNVMRLPDIVALGPLVQAVASDTGVLALWCPNPLLDTHGFPTMAAWGFTYKQRFDWIKTSKAGTPRPGMGRMFRNASESALIGVRGKPKCLNHSQLNVDLHPWLGHSAKPDTLQLRLERMFEGQRLELFARRVLAGWTCLGDEIDGLDIRAALGGLLGAG